MERRFRAKVTGKGQVQVPRPVREALKVKAGDDLVFRVTEDGAVYVTAEPAVSLMDLAGCLRSKVRHEYAGLEAEEQAGPEAAVERDNRVLRDLDFGRKPRKGDRQ